MSYFKEHEQSAWEHGWHSESERYVCQKCVNDNALKVAIKREEQLGVFCSFCESSPAAPLDALLEPFVHGLSIEYAAADDAGVSYNSREGGYQWDVVETDELVTGYFSDILVGDGLPEAVARAMESSVWVERDFAWRRRDVALRDAWDLFCETVKHKTRYVFWFDKDSHAQDVYNEGEIAPSLMLSEIEGVIHRTGLCLKTLPAGTRIWRAQTDGTPIDVTASRMGTAPSNLSRQPNRMSPAGIPMFYGSFDKNTCIKEVGKANHYSAIAQFKTSRSCRVLDLTDLPNPTVFDPRWGKEWRYVRFLNQFVRDMAQPIDVGDEHIEYVPTQIVTEFFLRLFDDGERVEGILYNSAREDGGKCVVLDVPTERCVESFPVGEASHSLHLVLDPASVESWNKNFA